MTAEVAEAAAAAAAAAGDGELVDALPTTDVVVVVVVRRRPLTSWRGHRSLSMTADPAGPSDTDDVRQTPRSARRRRPFAISGAQAAELQGSQPLATNGRVF